MSSGPDEPRRRRRQFLIPPREKRPVWPWIVIPLSLIAAAVGAKYSYHWLKTKRAEQFAVQGESFAQAQKWNEAAQKYRAALQLDPLGYRPLRDAALLATRLDRPEDVDLWEQVAKLPQCTTQDRQQYAEVLLKRGRFPTAGKIIDPLLRNEPDVKTLSLAAQYSRRTGDNNKAIQFARLAAKRAPNDDDVTRFQLADLLASSPDATAHAEAREILWSIVDRKGAARQSAIEALARAPDLPAEERTRALEALDSLGSPNIADALLAADLRLQPDPEESAVVFDETIAKWSAGENAQLVDLARWLNFHQQPERVLALFPIGRALSDNQLLLARLDALAILQRWTDIDNLLAQPDLTIDPSVTEAFRARTAQEKNSALDAELHWNHAVSLASSDPYKLRFVANFAEQSHANDVARKAYEELAKYSEHAAFAYQATERLGARTGDIGAQRSAAEKISTRSPDDPNAAAQLAYLNLLANKDVDLNATKAKALVEKYPDRLSFRVAAALGYLRKKDPSTALAQFKGPPIDWSKTPPAWRVVYAATLRANNDESAKEIIAAIPTEKLSPEERALIGK